MIPTIGFGTFLINNDDCKTSVYKAIQAGYRHIDTAEGYENDKNLNMDIEKHENNAYKH